MVMSCGLHSVMIGCGAKLSSSQALQDGRGKMSAAQAGPTHAQTLETPQIKQNNPGTYIFQPREYLRERYISDVSNMLSALHVP